MKKEYFLYYYCLNNIFSADDEYITFNEANKVIFDVYDDNGRNIYGSPEIFKLLKEDVKNKKLSNINSLIKFDKYIYENVSGKRKLVPSNMFNFDLGNLIKDEYAIKYFFSRYKNGKFYNVKLEDIDNIEITLYKKIYFNENSNLIFNGTNFNLKDIYICKDIFDLCYKDQNENLGTFMGILKYFENQIKDIPEDLSNDKFYVESYKTGDGDSCTLKEGENFNDFIQNYINSVKKGEKTELVINSFANYEYDEIYLNKDLSKKYKIEDNEKYEEFATKIKDFVENFIEELNDKKDKKLLTDEVLTNSIQKEFGNGIIIESEDEPIINRKKVKIIINDINNCKDFINSKKIHLNFEAPDGYIFEDAFKNDVDVVFSEYDDINEDTGIIECVSKISHIDFKNIKNEILFKDIDENDSELQELEIDSNKGIENGLFYKIKLKEPISGITKEFDKNNLLIKINFDIDNNIKAKYELDGNFNNIIFPNNKIKIGKKISDLKTYINSNLGKNITNYEIKENGTVVNDDDKVLTNNATYIFIFKQGSNCIKEKPKEKEQKDTESSEQNNNNNNNNDNDNDKKGSYSGKTKKGCC